MAKTRIADVLTFPMAPMLDVVFEILIYFVFTFHADLPEAHLAVNMASSRPGPEHTLLPPVLEVRVLPGQFLLQGVPRSLTEIEAVMKDQAALDRTQTVLVKISTGSQAKELVSVLDTCKGAGLANLNVLTLK
jgi:biopolymer transport protein ExbD